MAKAIIITVMIIYWVSVIYVPIMHILSYFWYKFCKKNKECRNLTCKYRRECKWNSLYTHSDKN